ncbi:hypothetical protein BJV78DRAFT_1142961, partial [Lactifluus subvellereus]
ETVTDVKARARNRNNESQICRFLDHAEKCRRFDLATAIRDASIDFRSIDPVVGIICDHDNDADDNDDNDLENLRDTPTHRLDTTAALLSTISPVKQLAGMPQRAADYFSLAHMLNQGSYPHAPSPHCTFVGAQTALHLNSRPSYSRMKIDVVATKLKLPDLGVVLSDYLAMCAPDHCCIIGPAGNLPFNTLEVWEKLRVQNRAYHAPHEILPAQTINAISPSTSWPCGCADTVLVNTNSDAIWPRSGMTGMKIICTSYSILIHAKGIKLCNCFESFLSYTQKFEIIPQINEKLSGSSRQKGPYPHFASSMFVLQQVRHPNQNIAVEIIPLKQVRALVELVPVFGEAADRRLTKETSLEYSRQFWLDKYFDKELYYALTV